MLGLLIDFGADVSDGDVERGRLRGMNGGIFVKRLVVGFYIISTLVTVSEMGDKSVKSFC